MFYKYTPDANNYAGISIPRKNMPNIPILEQWAKLTSLPLGVSSLHYVNQKLLQQWIPPVVEILEDNPPKEGDFPSLSDFWRVPVFSDRAWRALSPVIGKWCEPLPIIYPSGSKYILVHILEALDCLDVHQSKVGRRKTDQGISAVYEYSFKQGVVDGAHIFKLTPETGGDLIVDEVFRATVEKSNLQGLLFRPLKMAM